MGNSFREYYSVKIEIRGQVLLGALAPQETCPHHAVLFKERSDVIDGIGYPAFWKRLYELFTITACMYAGIQNGHYPPVGTAPYESSEALTEHNNRLGQLIPVERIHPAFFHGLYSCGIHRIIRHRERKLGYYHTFKRSSGNVHTLPERGGSHKHTFSALFEYVKKDITRQVTLFKHIYIRTDPLYIRSYSIKQGVACKKSEYTPSQNIVHAYYVTAYILSEP